MLWLKRLINLTIEIQGGGITIQASHENGYHFRFRKCVTHQKHLKLLLEGEKGNKRIN